MSMLNKLKETARNPVFMDEDESSPAPPPSEFGGMQEMMKSMSINQPPATDDSPIRVSLDANGSTRKMDPSEYKDWVCVYPCYIDAAKSVCEGRKIGKEFAAKEPHAYHMALAVQRLGFSVVYEGKRHPRDWANPGRVRVQLKSSDGALRNPQITNRKELFRRIAAALPDVQSEKLPKGIVSPMMTATEIQEITGIPALPSFAPPPSQPTSSTPVNEKKQAKQKKPKVKYVRG